MDDDVQNTSANRSRECTASTLPDVYPVFENERLPRDRTTVHVERIAVSGFLMETLHQFPISQELLIALANMFHLL
ncbi:MAG: hypothetical protein HPM95_10010 [Alphaproteobacteria bacterium]|nr:hypothetical protein [Alphaproteobacteria bacterium]